MSRLKKAANGSKKRLKYFHRGAGKQIGKIEKLKNKGRTPVFS